MSNINILYSLVAPSRDRQILDAEKAYAFSNAMRLLHTSRSVPSPNHTTCLAVFQMACRVTYLRSMHGEMTTYQTISVSFAGVTHAIHIFLLSQPCQFQQLPMQSTCLILHQVALHSVFNIARYRDTHASPLSTAQDLVNDGDE